LRRLGEHALDTAADQPLRGALIKGGRDHVREVFTQLGNGEGERRGAALGSRADAVPGVVRAGHAPGDGDLRAAGAGAEAVRQWLERGWRAARLRLLLLHLQRDDLLQLRAGGCGDDPPGWR